MEKTATLNLRVNPDVKREAEIVLEALGIPMSTAVGMFLRQISLTRSIPFPLTVPAVPRSMDADRMSSVEVAESLSRGLADVRSGNVVSVDELRAEFS